MADRIYGVDRGGEVHDVVDQLTSPTKDFELVVDLAESPTREEVVLAIDIIKAYIMQSVWPPASS